MPQIPGLALGGVPKFYNLGMRPGRMQGLAMPHIQSGPIMGSTGGRADARKMAVKAGSYVIPSAVVSHLGQGNTLAGNRVIDSMFKTGPYGMAPAPKMPRGGGMGIPRPPRVAKFADGGGLAPLAQQPEPEPVPIFAADGENILSPEQVAAVGGGDLKRGHEILDEWVNLELKKAADEIRRLPGPRQR